MMKLGEMGKISGNAYTALEVNGEDGEASEEDTEKSDLVSIEEEKRNSSLMEFCSSPSILKKSGHIKASDKLIRKVGVTNNQVKIVKNLSCPPQAREETQPKPRARQQHSLFGDPEKGQAVNAHFDVEAVQIDHAR